MIRSHQFNLILNELSIRHTLATQLLQDGYD